MMTTKDSTRSTLVTIGFFDGVHKGHRYLLSKARSLADQLHLELLVITFRDPARCVMDPDFKPELILTASEKKVMLESVEGVHCEMLTFTRDLLGMSAQAFMEHLRKAYQMKALLVGYDHHFGHDRSKGYEDYRLYGQEMGVEVIRMDPFIPEDAGQPVSSSLIRTLIKKGEIIRASELLGYPFFLEGPVLRGDGIGTGMGYATANLRISSRKILPGAGVYACRVKVEDGSQLNGMLYIGSRPTVLEDGEMRIEVHILDFNKDLYGSFIRLEIVDHIRKEMRFGGLDELAAQITKDEKRVREVLGISKK